MIFVVAELNATFQNAWARDPAARRGTQKRHRAEGRGEGRRHRRMLPLAERGECFTVLQAPIALPRCCQSVRGRKTCEVEPRGLLFRS